MVLFAGTESERATQTSFQGNNTRQGEWSLPLAWGVGLAEPGRHYLRVDPPCSGLRVLSLTSCQSSLPLVPPTAHARGSRRKISPLLSRQPCEASSPPDLRVLVIAAQLPMATPVRVFFLLKAEPEPRPRDPDIGLCGSFLPHLSDGRARSVLKIIVNHPLHAISSSQSTHLTHQSLPHQIKTR